jgi:hypothetical protein
MVEKREEELVLGYRNIAQAYCTFLQDILTIVEVKIPHCKSLPLPILTLSKAKVLPSLSLFDILVLNAFFP